MRRIVAGTGRSLITVGLLILLFVGYQLWGTGWFTARSQRALERELEEVMATAATATTRPPTTTSSGPAPTGPTSTSRPPTTSTSTPTNLPVIAEGDPIGWIRIPKISVDWVFVQGTDREELKEGPGHYPTTVLPGQIGNAAIAGHRTTYGQPFNRLDELAVGDEIEVQMPYIGTFVYRLTREPFAVSPSAVEVAAQDDALRREIAMITLTTCHPEFSAAERLVVHAELVVEKSERPIARARDLPVTVEPVDQGSGEGDGLSQEARDLAAVEDALSGDPGSKTPAVVWGIFTAVVGLLWWWAYRRFRHPLTWLAGVVPFAVPLVGFYIYLERALPAGY